MTNLMHNYVILNVYYYKPLHVSSNTVLIIRRSNCINTAYGIILPVNDRPLCRLRRYDMVLFSREIGLKFDTKGGGGCEFFFPKSLHQTPVYNVEDINLNLSQ